ncbi:hypothetical protein [Candidatus Borrarchaeum sp.]|uniref:hypothetical protein n=1 Tax=Candidatus Borrarchaeum sp. TaxID=2846742 RepID=UPI00257AC098|nr:hypothetical protein [Candidatus Borrarchaeum sp.]
MKNQKHHATLITEAKKQVKEILDREQYEKDGADELIEEYNQLLKENMKALQKARAQLEEAQKRARKIIRDAKKQADEILTKAKADLKVWERERRELLEAMKLCKKERKGNIGSRTYRKLTKIGLNKKLAKHLVGEAC